MFAMGRDYSDYDLREGSFSKSLHPLLRPNNSITWRFLPGVILGALLHAWISHGTTPQQQVQVRCALDECKCCCAVLPLQQSKTEYAATFAACGVALRHVVPSSTPALHCVDTHRDTGSSHTLDVELLAYSTQPHCACMRCL